VAGGEKRYPHSSTPKATTSPPPFINNLAANRGALGENAPTIGGGGRGATYLPLVWILGAKGVKCCKSGKECYLTIKVFLKLLFAFYVPRMKGKYRIELYLKNLTKKEVKCYP
jgi:hypothetical protein